MTIDTSRPLPTSIKYSVSKQSTLLAMYDDVCEATFNFMIDSATEVYDCINCLIDQYKMGGSANSIKEDLLNQYVRCNPSNRKDFLGKLSQSLRNLDKSYKSIINDAACLTLIVKDHKITTLNYIDNVIRAGRDLLDALKKLDSHPPGSSCPPVSVEEESHIREALTAIGQLLPILKHIRSKEQSNLPLDNLWNFPEKPIGPALRNAPSLEVIPAW